MRYMYIYIINSRRPLATPDSAHPIRSCVITTIYIGSLTTRNGPAIRGRNNFRILIIAVSVINNRDVLITSARKYLI